MANVTTLLKYSLKTNIVKSIFFEIVSKVSRYYYTFGRTTAWPTVTAYNSDNIEYVVSSEEDPPAVSDAYPAELAVRRDMIYMKNIDANDAAIVIRRVNWAPGVVYDMFDDYTSSRPSYNGAQSIDQALFYVLTDEYNVYKCLYNNSNGLSVNKPVGTSTEPFIAGDGYIWKFMYTIPLALRNKFLTTSYMPVTTALTNQFYSNGSIVSYAIENRGSKYIKNAWGVKNFVILDGGIGYAPGDITIVFPASTNAGITATAEVSAIGDLGNIADIAITQSGTGYEIQPEPTILVAPSSSGSGFKYIVEYQKDNSAYTELKVTGDGYNELNPYSLKSITITDRGVFTSAPAGDLFTFPSPQLRYGRRPVVDVTFRQIDGSSSYEVDTINVVDQGYGYTEKLVFGQNVFAGMLTTDNSGFDCELDEAAQKNEAIVIPLINSSGEIEAIQVVQPGVGYTYASVEVIGKKTVLMVPEDPNSGNLVDISSDPSDYGYTEGFIKGQVALNFGIGDIETKQSNVELLAVDGAIPVIAVDNDGNGYPSSTTITIIGDGTGCTCEPVIEQGHIKAVYVTNPGSGYTYANAVITPLNQGSSAAIVRPIISPKGGHGRDAVAELYAKTIQLVTKLSGEFNQGVPIENDYRQVSIIKNPKEYGSQAYYRKASASTCALFQCDINSVNTVTYNTLEVDDTLYFSANKTFTLVEKRIIDNKYYLVAQVNDNYVPPGGSTIYKLVDGNAYNMSISIVTQPEINKFSGEMLYIDNRLKFSSTTEQTVVVSTLISF